ncbi:DUF861 domain-containing protein [Glaciihabitans arcticus]|uniref:DUF861 domain-containing protein n=1 Tax=Glaciihabitans arcticus TaxID=2668039 RepID=A0A4Q9GV68_9MICO|nr:cupin domain-containing protein [Glaciihabitans arcticus]TBN57097.1 DUF861 domain-containing protein [Glaciihabitans arcticus]
MIDLVAAQAVSLAHDPVPAEQVVAGEPSTGSVALGTLADAEYGVWEMTPGAMSDVEEDELFVVLFGVATVAFADGAFWTLGPGSTGRLDAGSRTVWTVTETLRKVYVTG